MSGAIEAVGLALAGFTLVISFLEHHEEGFDTLRDWVFFRREFTHLVNDLNREQIIFRQLVESMLRSIIDSEFELKEMMENAQSDQWKSQDLALKMKQKLCGDGEYESYQSSLWSIHEHLVSMEKKLNSCGPTVASHYLRPEKTWSFPLTQEQDNASGDASHKGLQFQKMFRKLQFIIRKKKWQEKVVYLGRQIDRVGKLFGEAETLAPARQSRVGATHEAFGRTKCQASSLHTAITKGWTCTCDKPHFFKLVIRRPKIGASPETGSSVLKVSFPLRPLSGANQAKQVSDKDAWCTFDTTMVAPYDKSSLSHTKFQGGESYSSESGSVRPILASTISTETATAASSASRGRALPPPQVRTRSTSTITIPDSTMPIDDLCRAIQIRGKEACLGYLDDGRGSYHVFHINSSFTFTSAEIGRVISLGEILDHNSHQTKEPKDQGGSAKIPATPRLSRRTRMSIALTLAYAILELYPTPWLPKFFGKTHIYFFQRRDGDIMVENPFLLCEAFSVKEDCRPQPPPSPPHPAREEDHMGALLALGIMIMELWFGQTLESLSFWRDHCDVKGQEKEFTSLTAALKWQKKTKDEAGITLHQITHRCIRGNFGVTSMNLDDMNCVRAVYDQVVKPLEGLLGHFWPA